MVPASTRDDGIFIDHDLNVRLSCYHLSHVTLAIAVLSKRPSRKTRTTRGLIASSLDFAFWVMNDKAAMTAG